MNKEPKSHEHGFFFSLFNFKSIVRGMSFWQSYKLPPQMGDGVSDVLLPRQQNKTKVRQFKLFFRGLVSAKNLSSSDLKDSDFSSRVLASS